MNRSSNIYFIQVWMDGPIKIGRAANVARRLEGLQVANASRLVLLAAVPGSSADEAALHCQFKRRRIRGEWFEPSPQLMATIRFARENGKLLFTRAEVSRPILPCTAALLREIENFLASVNPRITETAFGLGALRDGRFVSELRAGRRVWPETAQKVRRFIRAHADATEAGLAEIARAA